MKGIIRGYDIRRYATAPAHEYLVEQVCNSMIKRTVEGFMNKYAPNAPVTYSMVKNSAEKFEVDEVMLAAILQVDSNFGQKGLGARTKNPGNYGNMDDGSIKVFDTWEDGVDAVAGWLKRHKI